MPLGTYANVQVANGASTEGAAHSASKSDELRRSLRGNPFGMGLIRRDKDDVESRRGISSRHGRLERFLAP